ncbi:carbohydrate-binding protein [Actinoplanes sp. NPDC051851]|uniref:carbohydrate-binding protein n=1 Tax=Actinoplanes sp. NPDC051851 TaxID=3154753 RepID=UPI003438DB99
MRSFRVWLVMSGTLVLALAPVRADAAETITRTIFSDTFSGSTISTTNWESSGASLDGEGHLVVGSPIRSAKTFTQSNGHAEARIQASQAPSEPQRVFGVLTAEGEPVGGEYTALGSADVSRDGFHTYTIDWTTTTITWSADGTKVVELTRATAGEALRLTLKPSDGDGDRWGGGGVTLADSVTVTAKYSVAVVPAKKWQQFHTYQAGDRVTYNDVTYRVKAMHTSLPGWEPGLVPNLFQKI